jgi:hypothetical protein
MTQLPTVLSRIDIEEQEGKQVRVVGRYIQVDVRYRKSAPPLYEGHVAVILDDGTTVFLYPTWHEHAIRSADEISKYENQWVVVVGTIVSSIPNDPRAYPHQAARILAPCMLAIDSIQVFR